MLGDMKFLESLKEYDKDNIQTEIIAKIRNQYLTNPDFNPTLIKNISSACQGLCKWVVAVCRYDEIFKVIFFLIHMCNS
jgi:dynein heavy chain